jgi:D-3-phosphoglycerate dehydrogenase
MTLVLSTSPGFGRHGSVPDRLAGTGWQVVRCLDPNLPDGGVSAHIADADFLVVGLHPVMEATIAGARRLKGVLKHGVGVDNIDLAACSVRGVPVLNAPGSNAQAVAELAVGLMFALARNIPASHADVGAGRWLRQAGSEIGGRTLGIVGLGNIGRALARLALGLGMSVVANDPFPNRAFLETHPVEMVPLDRLLAQADYVSLHLFGGDGNAALMNAERMARMKPGARLLNLARGEIVDLDALHALLESGHLAGAAIDAYQVEPPDVCHPIFRNPKAVFMPHSGGDTLEAMERIGLMNIADMEALLAGRMPERVLNADALRSGPLRKATA